MRLRLIWVGKTKDERLRALAEDYVRRLSRFCRTEVTELREGAGADDRAVLAEEGKRITDALTAGSYVVLLDVEGRQWSSPELATEFERWQNEGRKEVAFVIGGHFGVSEAVRKCANLRWSLSKMTLTHEMARVVLVEQLYRAYTILRGVPYQK